MNEIKIGQHFDLKVGLITREVYRISENKFEINDTSGQWLIAIVDLETIKELMCGNLHFIDLDWK
jgi:hypothetical protein